MPIDLAVRAALRRFERRAIVVSFVKALSIALLALALTAEIAALVGVRSVSAITALAVIAMAASAVYAVVQRPSPLALARRIDARSRLSDLIVTAIDCGEDGMAAMVRRAALAVLAGESPRRAIPFEAPRRWRRWVAGAAAVQLVAIPMWFRAPAARATASGLSALTIPDASGAAGTKGKSDRQDTAPKPAALDASSSAAARPAGEIARPGSPQGSDAVTASERAAAAARPGADDQLRLALANADADIAAGRVPLARRAIVERYFAAIQSQRRRPR